MSAEIERRVRELMSRPWPVGPGTCGACGIEVSDASGWARHFAVNHEGVDAGEGI